MPQNLRAIRRKIRTVQSIAKITRAMKMVAAAKLRRVQGLVENGRAYWDALDVMIGHVATQSEEVSHPLLEDNDAESVAVLLFGGSRGLCGSYNVLFHREAEDLVGSFLEPVKLWTVGPKVHQFVSKLGREVSSAIEMPDDANRLDVALKLAQTMRTEFLEARVGAVYAVYTQFESAMRQRPVSRRLLPVEPIKGTQSGDSAHYIFEPPAPELLGSLLPRAIDAAVYRMLLESAASEEGSRMVAMTAATDNAEDLIVNLSRELNRARQAHITTELLEIISGAEALASG